MHVLDALSKQQLAVYLEIDPATSTVTRLLIPQVTRIVAIRPATQDALEIELELSPARHTLTRGTRDYDELERSLRDALESGRAVTVTEDDGHEIIDIRAFTPGPEGPPRARRGRRRIFLNPLRCRCHGRSCGCGGGSTCSC